MEVDCLPDRHVGCFCEDFHLGDVEHGAYRRRPVEHDNVGVVVQVEPAGAEMGHFGLEIGQGEWHAPAPLDKAFVELLDDLVSCFKALALTDILCGVDLAANVACDLAQGEDVQWDGHGRWLEIAGGGDCVAVYVFIVGIGKWLKDLVLSFNSIGIKVETCLDCDVVVLDSKGSPQGQ